MIGLLAIDWAFILEKLILIISIVSISLVIAMYETYAERKVAAVMQDPGDLTVQDPSAYFSRLRMD